jgi:uncharacterized repeat protein (TIGR01451 family)
MCGMASVHRVKTTLSLRGWLAFVGLCLFAGPGLVANGQVLSVPAVVMEGVGTLTNAGSITLSGVAASATFFALQSTDPASVTIPSGVTIPVGQSNAFFNITVGDNLVVDGDRLVEISATVSNVLTLTNVIKVMDNDPDHIRFGPVPSLTDTNTAFGVQLRAENADGSLQTNFNLSLTMMAEGLEGVLPVEPANTGNFYQGQLYLSFRVTAPGHAVRLRATEYPGQSDVFTVIPPAFYAIAQPVSDIAWHAASQTLLASVPASGGPYANCLVAIDPATGLVTNSYPVGNDPGQIEMSPAGSYLYVTISNRTALQRFDLNTRVAGLKFALGTNSSPFRFAFDFCVPPGLSDAAVVEARDQDALGNTTRVGVFRYTGGVPVLLPNFFGSGGWRLEALDTAFDTILSPPLARGNASTGAILATGTNFLGNVVTYRSGQLYDDHGNFYSTGNLTLLGAYPNVLDQPYYTALAEVDPVLRRVFYLSGTFNYGASFYKLKAYDRDLIQPLFQLTVPSVPGSPARFLRCGSNVLAYATDNGQLWFIRPDATQPPGPTANLALSYSGLPAFATVGSSYTFSLSLSNAGPGIASIVRVTNALPANATVVQTSSSTGAVASDSSGFTWNVAALPAGSNATLQVTLVFNTAGWQTNTTWALGFEPDPIFTNNVVTLPLYVRLSPGALGVFVLNYSSEDLVYDPARDRLLLSVGSGMTPGQANGLAVFDPYGGLTETFAPLGKRPSKLARSDNGQYLYVSLPDDALVRRFDLAALNQNLEFALGGEYIYGDWYPFYAWDLAVVPGAPQSVVAWRVRRAGPMADEYGQGIASFQNGVMASNVTASGGIWEVEFDRDSGTLFGYNSGDLRRCSLDSSGVSFVEQYPEFYNAGSSIEYAAGQLFTSAGRLVQYQPFRVAWLFAGSENAALVEPDAVAGRVFYLTHNNSWQLKAYDVASRRLLGSVPLPDVVGTPSSLVRWGTNGLAFRTSGNQLYIIRSPLVQPNAAADLSLKLEGPASPVTFGSNAVIAMTLTNQGPHQATGVQITNTFSGIVSLVSVSTSVGTWTTNGGVLVWTIPALDAGTQVSLSYVVKPGQGGVVAATAAATAATPDPIAGNNTALQTLVVGAPLALDGAARVPIPANDLVWSPSLGRLLLTSATNTVNWSGALVSLDPLSMAVQFQSTLGSDAGRLAISREDSVVYAGVDSGVAALALSSLTVTNRFLLNPADPRGAAYDLKVAPGIDRLVLVGSRSRTDNSTWLGAYDGGIQRSNGDSFFTTGLGLEFGDDPAMLFCKDYTGNGFRRYTVNASGLSLLDADTSLLPTFTVMDLVWGNGRIYTSIGKVINPLNRTLIGTIPGIPAGSRVRYDPGSDRVFYLIPGGMLLAFDGSTLLPVGNRIVPGASGTLGSFVRWGLDGFAVINGAGQVVLFRSSLIATNPPADISVSLAHGPAPYVSGSNLTATIVVTNSGPNPATNVTWNNTLPIGTVIVNATSSLGSIVVASNTVTGSLPLLSVGTAATVQVTFTAPAAGIMTNQVFTVASSTDPAFANNSAAALLWIQSPTGLPATVSLSLPVKDLERDPIRPLLYASFGPSAGPLADSVVSLDPVNGNISAPVRVGSDPGRLAASPDGQFLYVALDGAGTVQKLALPGLTFISSFAVPQNQIVTRLVVSPVNPDMVVLRRSSGKATLHVSGVQQPGELTAQDLFAFSQTSGQLFGCDGFHSNVKLYRLNTSSSGLTLLEAQPGKQSLAGDLKSSGEWLCFDRGMVMNPDTTRVHAIMPVPANSVVEPDAGSGRVFYLTPAGSVWTLRAFDLGQAIEVGSVPVPTLASAPRRLVRWGTDGLAFYNTNSQVVILRGQLVPTNPPIDLVLKQSVSSITATTNDLVNVSLQLTNPGPVTASGVVVTQTFSLPVTNIVVSVTGGSAIYTNGATTWQLGNLAAGAVASLTLTLRAPQPGTLNLAAAAYHNLNDSFWGNNVALNAVNIFNPAASNILQIRLTSRDLVYDFTRDRIYASTPASNRLGGNLIAVINPVTGEMERTLPAGSEPDQLALADNGRLLHVALDGAMGVQRFDLQSNAADLSYPLGTNDIYFAQDLEVQPGHPETVVASLGSYNFAAGFPSDVVIYDGGVPRLTNGGPSRGLTFAADGSCLFGYVSPGSSFGFVRMWPGPDGFRTETVPGFTSVPGDLKFGNGRLYSFSGQVIDPYVPVSIGSVLASGPQAIDAVAGRAYYLAQKGSSWELRAYDVATLLPVGTQAVASVLGTPGSLIRCGADRLAFRTSSNQLFIVRSPLVSTNPLAPANLTVVQQASQDFTAPTETLRFVITVTNSGPGAASNVLLAIKPPASVASLTPQVPQGSVTNLSGNFLCNLGSLPAGQSLAVILSAVITNTSSYTNFVSVSAAVPDPEPVGNTSSLSIQGLFFQRPDSFNRVTLAARDLAYDRVSDRLFVGMLGSNAIAWLNPETALVEGMIPLGAPPDHLAISDDGQYLYVCSSSTSLVQRILLPARAVDFSFNLPVGYPLYSALVLPGQPHALAVSCAAYPAVFTGVLDDGIPRTNQLTNPFKLLAISEDGGTLFGYDNGSTGGASPDVFRMTLDSSGLTVFDYGPSDTPWGNNVDLNFYDGRLYFGNGDVLDPNGWITETPFPRFNYGQWVEINPSAGEAIFAGVPVSTAQVGIYDLTTRQQLTLMTLPGVSSVASLTQCGADRLAFRNGSEIVFVRSSAIPAADLALRGDSTTNQVTVGDAVTLQLTVSNAGPYAVSGVLLTNRIPPGFDVVSVVLSQGILSTNGSILGGSIGALNTNATAILTLVLSPNGTRIGWVTNLADVSASALSDPVPFNNHLGMQLRVLPKDSDHDGLPDDWELAHGLDPLNPADALIDSDCDGTSNLQEYQAGTDPLIFDNLRIVSLQPAEPGIFGLTVHAAIGKTYTVETSTNLLQWSPLSAFVCETDNQKVSVPWVASLPASFYRLRTTTNAPQPFLSLLNGSSLLTGPPRLQIIAPPGYGYSLQTSTNLMQWVDLTNFQATSCSTVITDSAANGANVRFYRVKTQ